MSGGSLNYFYQEVSDIIAIVREKNHDYQNSDQMIESFAVHLERISNALHDVEWVFSGDYSVDQCYESVNACLGQESIAYAIKQTEQEIKRMELELVARRSRLDALKEREVKEVNGQ